MEDRQEVKQLLTGLNHRDVTVLDLVELKNAAGVPDGKRLAVTLTRTPPARKDTGPREHEINDAEGFVTYLRRYGTEATVVFVDQARSEILAVLDEGSEKGVEIVTLKPAVHPRWRPWHDLLDKTIELSRFVEFLRDNRKAVASPDGREVLHLLSQVKASTSVTLHQGKGNGALNGLLIQTKIAGQAQGKESVVDLPDKVVVRSPFFVAGEERSIEIYLIVEGQSGGTAITAKLSSADLREAEIAAFAEYADVVRGLEETPGCVVVYGRPHRGEWAVER